MTSSEYLQYCNEDNKSHPDSAYDMTLDKLQSAVGNPSTQGFSIIRQFTLKGLVFRLMVNTTKRRYAMRNPDPSAYDPWLKIDGKTAYYSDDEAKELGLRIVELAFRIYDDEDRVVASAQDEYNTMLIMTASEYRGFGLGTIIGKIARTYEPGKSSGGFTAAGAKNFIRVHREFVRDALTSGLYSKLVRAGDITVERVREIVTSAKVQMRPRNDGVDLSSNSSDDWLLFGEHGAFILYDRKLATLIDNEKYESFVEKMIKGMVYAVPSTHSGITHIKTFGGEREGIKSFMLALVYTDAKAGDSPLWVEHEEYDLKGFEYGPETKEIGYSAKEIISGKTIDYRAMVAAEAAFRKGFDKYGEFKHRLMEIAYAKY